MLPTGGLPGSLHEQRAGAEATFRGTPRLR